MKRAQASEIIALIAAHYPTTKLTETIVSTWEMRLLAFPEEVARKAALSITLRLKFFPSLAELVDEMVSLHLDLPSIEEAWSMVCLADGLARPEWPEELKEAVLSIGGNYAFRMAKDRLSLRFAFMPAYEGMLQRRKRQAIEEELPEIAKTIAGRNPVSPVQGLREAPETADSPHNSVWDPFDRVFVPRPRR